MPGFRLASPRGGRILLSLLTVSAYLLLVYLWFRGSVPQGMAPLSFSFGSLILPGLVLALGLAGLLYWSPPRLFADPIDTRWAAALAGLAALSRAPFLWCAYGLFSSDAAAQGVMALHILEGKHHPVLLYNWSYIGSLKAHLTALLALGLRDPVVSFAAAALVMYSLFVGSLFALARTVLSRREAVFAAGYAIFSPGFLTAWGIHNEGSYIDVLAFGTLVLVLGARYLAESEKRVKRAFGMGFWGGLAFWTHILASYYLLAALGALALGGRNERRRSFLAFGAGFAVGDFPALLWNYRNDWASFRWWTQGQTAAGEWLGRTAVQLKETFATALPVLSGLWPADAPPPGAWLWRVFLLALFPTALVVFALRERKALAPLKQMRLTPAAGVLGFAALVVAVFAQSSFGWLAAEPRYLLFLFSVLPLFFAALVGSLARRSRAAAALVAGLLLAVNLHGSGTYLARAFFSDGDNRQFVRELLALGVRAGHTDYFISYKYNFLSREELVFTSALGPSQTEWYLPYREEVSRAERLALVPRSFRMARRLERRLRQMGVGFRRADLLYPVLYDLDPNLPLESLR